MEVVEMDVSGVHHHHHHHQQDMSSQTLESMLACNKAQQDKKPRPPEEALKCPRCDSSNTKFCYYNNYSLTQPRYFCKSCRRYWTKGGTLRNVPVGGGCRKNKRSSSSSSATSSNSSATSSALSKIRGPHDHHLIQHHQQQPHPLSIMTSNSNNHLLSGFSHLPYDSTCTDLSLAFARLQSQANGHMGYDHFDHNDLHLGGNQDPNSTTQGNPLGFLDAIRGGFLDNSGGMLYGGGNIGNGNLMGLNNGGGGTGSGGSHDEDQEILNHHHHHHQMFADEHHQEVVPQLMNNNNSNNNSSCCGAATTAVTMTTVKQETCNNMMRSSSEQMGMGENRGGVLWGFPWQMGAGGGGDQGNLIHEVESGGRSSQIGGWNGIGSTTWHGLINSPLM